MPGKIHGSFLLASSLAHHPQAHITALTVYLGIVSPTVGWAFLHQWRIKTNPPKTPHKPTWARQCLSQGFCSLISLVVKSSRQLVINSTTNWHLWWKIQSKPESNGLMVLSQLFYHYTSQEFQHVNVTIWREYHQFFLPHPFLLFF